MFFAGLSGRYNIIIKSTTVMIAMKAPEKKANLIRRLMIPNISDRNASANNIMINTIMSASFLFLACFLEIQYNLPVASNR